MFIRVTSVISLLLLAMTGCYDFNNPVDPNAASHVELWIDSPSVTVPLSGSQTLTAAGGCPPYSFTLVSGDGAVDPAAGVYTAPAVSSSFVVRIIDQCKAQLDIIGTVDGLGCGGTYTEDEPSGSNDDGAPPWTNTNDLALVLAPGCTMTVSGVTDTGGSLDVYRLNTGTAASIDFTATWASGGNDLEMRLYSADGSTDFDSKSTDSDIESFLWPVATAGVDKYLEITPKGSGGTAYTLVITGG